MMKSGASTPMKVMLFMNGSLAESGASIGGGDVVMYKFIRHSKLQPDILIPTSAQQFIETKGKLFLTRKNLPPTLTGILILYLIRILQGTWIALRNGDSYDVALASSPFSVDIIPLYFWKAKRKGAVIFHLLPDRKAVNLTTRLRFGLAAIEQFLMLRLFRRACDFLVAGNEVAKQQLEAAVPGKPVYLLDAGFDAEAIDRIPEQPRDSKLACFVGRMTSQKGIFDLVSVMEKLKTKRPGFRLVMVGTGPEKELLQREIEKRELDNIELAGFASNEQKIALLKRSGFFFFPSYEEGWGIALCEALYCECRCVCYELSHYRSVFNDYPAYAKLGDPEDFVRAFEKSGAIKPAQKEFVARYDDPLIAKRLVGHLREVAQE